MIHYMGGGVGAAFRNSSLHSVLEWICTHQFVIILVAVVIILICLPLTKKNQQRRIIAKPSVGFVILFIIWCFSAIGLVELIFGIGFLHTVISKSEEVSFGLVFFILFMTLPILLCACSKRAPRTVTVIHTIKPADPSKPFEIQNELLRIDSMDGHEFEYWCADLLGYNGFSKICVTQGSGDQGVDIIAWHDEKEYAIQCKRYASDLGNKPVQEVFAGKTIYHCDVAAVMTNSNFTRGAVEAAAATEVCLWGRTTIEKMLREKKRVLHQQSVKAKKEEKQRSDKKVPFWKRRKMREKEKTTKAHGLIDEEELYHLPTDDSQ